jgi:hypothetical protein
MNCPTCEREMNGLQSLNSQLPTRLFWCLRCGTLRIRTDEDTDFVPRLQIKAPLNAVDVLRELLVDIAAADKGGYFSKLRSYERATQLTGKDEPCSAT